MNETTTLRIPNDEFEVSLFRQFLLRSLDGHGEPWQVLAHCRPSIGSYLGEGRYELEITYGEHGDDFLEDFMDARRSLQGWIALGFDPYKHAVYQVRFISQFDGGEVHDDQTGAGPCEWAAAEFLARGVATPGDLPADLLIPGVTPRPSFFSTTQVAAELGVDESRVRQLAQARGIGAKQGRDWAFTKADIEALREKGKPGPKPRA